MKFGQQKVNDFYHSKKILITGDRGYVGSLLYKKIRSFDCDVITFNGDVSSKRDWEDNLDGNLDLLFHLAAKEYSPVGDPYRGLSVNAVSALHMLEACKLKEISPKIVFASSSNIFGRSEQLPITEGQRDTPASVWSAHKLLAENYLSIYNEQLQTTISSLRLSNVYGPSTSVKLSQKMSLNKMIEAATNSGQLKLFNNASCIRDWVYIDDVVAAFLMAGTISDDKFHSFLIGAESNKTIAQTADIIVEKVKKHTGANVKIDFHKAGLPSMAMRNYVPSCGLFKKTTGWSIRHRLEHGIELTVKYFYENRES